MYTLDQLRGFVAVAEEESFGRAAERLRMTQPPLSRQIQKLEQYVGTPLIERSARGASLTPAGRTFLLEARRMLGLADSAPLNARRVANGTHGTIRMGFTAVVALNVLGRWVQLAKRRLPHVDLSLTEMVTTKQIEALLAGDLDIGLVRGVPRHHVLSAERLHTESLVLATPRNHILTQLGRTPTLADITHHDIVTYSPVEARYFHELVMATFSNAGTMPHYAQYVGQVNSVLALVDAGVGVALVPESAARIQLPGLQFIPVEGIPPDCVEVHCAWRKSNDSPAVKSLLRLALGKEKSLV